MERRGLVDKTAVTPQDAGRRGARAPTTSWSPGSRRRRRRGCTPSSRGRAIRTSPTPTTFRTPSIGSGWRWRAAAARPRRGATSARSLAAASKAPYYHAALRAYVDVCLDEHIAESCAAEIDKLGAEDVNEELAYLHGRALYDANHFERAEQRARAR